MLCGRVNFLNGGKTMSENFNIEDFMDNNFNAELSDEDKKKNVFTDEERERYNLASNQNITYEELFDLINKITLSD